MIGQETIIAARKARLKPESIFFEIDLSVPNRFYFDDPENALRLKMHARVVMSMSEAWRTYDFRFVTGCRVHLHADQWTDDLTDFAERLVEQGASHVIVACLRDGSTHMIEYVKGEWIAHRTV